MGTVKIQTMKHLIYIILVLLLISDSLFADGFGHEADGGYDLDIKDIMWIDFETPTTSGTIDSIKAYVTGTTPVKKFRLAIYKRSDSSVVDSFTQATAAAGTAWYYMQAYLNGTIEADEKYALAIWGQNKSGVGAIRGSLSGGDSTGVKAGTYDTWPDPYTGMSYTSDRWLSIYCYYTPAAAGGPVNALHSPDGSGVLHSPDGASVLHGP